MAEIRIERRRGPMLWVWLVGLVVLALLIWGIAELVNTDRDNQTMAAGDSANAPAVASAPDSGDAAPATEQAPGPASLEDLLPLGVQDVGQQVVASGTVLSTPSAAGFWLMGGGGNTVIWVKGNLKGITEGQAVQGILGTLRRAAPADVSSWLGATDIEKQTARHPYWQIQTALYLDASAPAAPARMAADSGAKKAAGRPGRTPATAHRRRRR